MFQENIKLKENTHIVQQKRSKQTLKACIYNQNVSQILQQCKNSNDTALHATTFFLDKQSNRNEKKLYRIPEKLKQVLNMKNSHQQVDDKHYLSKIYKKAQNRTNKQQSIRKVDLGESESLLKQKDFERLKMNDDKNQKDAIFSRLMSMSKGNSKNFQFKSSKCTPQISDNKDLNVFPQIPANKTFSNLIQPIANVHQQISRNLNWADSGNLHKKRMNSQQKKALSFLKRAGRHSNKVQCNLNSSLNRTFRKSSHIRQHANKLSNKYPYQLPSSEIAWRTEQQKLISQLVSVISTQQAQNGIHPSNIKTLFLNSNTHFQSLNSQQLLEQKKNILHQKIIKKAKQLQVSEFVTKQRIQALYECELLKGIKKLIGIRNFKNIKIQLEKQKDSCNTTNQQNKEAQTRLSYSETKTKNFKKKKIDLAQEALRKNRYRLKCEKKRVIEKLRF